VIEGKIHTLRSLGIPEDKIREVVSAHFLKPLEQLDHAQDKGLILDAESIPVDNGGDSSSSPIAPIDIT